MAKWQIKYKEVGKDIVGTCYHSGNLSREEVIYFFGLKDPDIEWYELDYMVSVEFPRKIYDEVSRALTEYEHPEEVGLTSQEAVDQIYFALVKLQNLMTDQI